jgi:hypothetical protein
MTAYCFAWLGRVNLLKHATNANQVVIEDLFGRIE